jgi:preprotein translocase subunit YajC
MNAGPLIFLVAMLAVFWFLLIRPQRQRQAAHRNLIAQIAPGDEVVTAGGMLGTIRTIADDHVLLEVAPGTEVRIAKEAVTGVRPKDQEPPAEAENSPLT